MSPRSRSRSRSSDDASRGGDHKDADRRRSPRSPRESSSSDEDSRDQNKGRARNKHQSRGGSGSSSSSRAPRAKKRRAEEDSGGSSEDMDDDSGDDDRNNNFRRRRPTLSSSDRGTTRESTTVMVRGLGPHTDDAALEAALAAFWPRRVRVVADRSRGSTYAFVDFPSLEYSRSFLANYPGSLHGRPHRGPKFSLDGYDLTIEYGRTLNPGSSSNGPASSSVGSGGSRPGSSGLAWNNANNNPGRGGGAVAANGVTYADWLCDGCGTVNFARRTRCFQCAVERPPNARMAASGEPVLPDPEVGENLRGRYDSDMPTASLAVYGLSQYSGEADLDAAFRAYAPVKDAKLLRDASGRTLGVGFVTFYNVESSTHALQTARATKLTIDGATVELAYSKGPAAAQVAANLVLAAQGRHPSSNQPPRVPHSRRPLSETGTESRRSGASRNARNNSPTSSGEESDQDARYGGSSSRRRRGERPSSRRDHQRDRDHRDHRDRRAERHHHHSGGTEQPPAQVASKKREWPPPFEKAGAAWAFHDSSGYFYEPTSGFYYDPKNKVYYNAHKKEYFYHTPHTDPPFTKYEASYAAAAAAAAAKAASTAATPSGQQQATTSSEETKTTDATAARETSAARAAAAADPPVATAQTGAATTTTKKLPGSAALTTLKNGPIAFGLGKTSSGGSSASNAGGAHPPKDPPRVAPAFAVSHLLAVGTDYDQLHRLAVDNRPVTKHCASTGKWLCLVSRRQFNDEGHLKKHIAKSQLYKDALEKAARENRIALK